MNASEREEIGALLSAYLDGEVSEEQHAEVKALLKDDAEARVLLAELEQAAGAVRTLPRGSVPPSVLESITARLERSELLGSADDQVTLERHRRGPLRSTLAMAAMLALAVSGVLYVSFKLSRTEEPTTKQLAQGRDSQPLPGEAEEALPGRHREDVGKRGKGPASADTRTNTHGLEEDLQAFKKKLTQPETERLQSLGYVGAAPVEADGVVESEEMPTKGSDSPAGVEPIAEPQLALAERLRSSGQGAGGIAKREDLSWGAVDEAEMQAGIGGVAPPATEDSRPDSVRPGRADPDPETMTLEQKLAGGSDLAVAAKHRFENEPVQLTVNFAGAGKQRAFDGRLRRLFADRKLEPVERIRRAGDLMTGRGVADLLDLNAVVRRTPVETTPAYFEGKATSNFTPRTTGEQQYIVRMPPEALEELITVASAAETKDVRLGIGMLTADGAANVQHLARQTLACDIAPTDDPEPEDASMDMMALLARVGLAPAAVFEGESPPRGRRGGRPSDKTGSNGQTARVADVDRESTSPESSDVRALADKRLSKEPKSRRKLGEPVVTREVSTATKEAPDRPVEDLVRPHKPAEQLITLVVRLAAIEPTSATAPATQPIEKPPPPDADDE